MKTKALHYFSFLLAILLGFSCAPKNDDVEEPTLTIQEKELRFDNSASEKSVAITTNQSKWVASSPKEGEWVEIAQSGNNMIVKVSPNTAGVERKTIILVNAGYLSEKIILTQSASDIVLEAQPESIDIPQKGGYKTIDINSNTESWTAELEEPVDWLTVTAKSRKGEIVLEALPNESSKVRTAKLVAKSGAKAVLIEISQQGVQKYFIPMSPKDNANTDNIIRFETKRGSVMKSFSAGLPAWGIDGGITFISPSDIMPTIAYTINGGDPMYKKATVLSYDYKEMTSDDFQAFLKENGFEPLKDAKPAADDEMRTIDYRSVEKALNLKLTLVPDVGAQLDFTPYITQDKAYPTFDKLPLDAVNELLNKKDKKVKEVKAYEEGKGSTLTSEIMNELPGHESEVSVLQFGTKDPKHSMIRIYFMNVKAKEKDPEPEPEMKESVSEMLEVFDEPSLMFWNAATADSPKMIITEEFETLLKTEGFVYDRELDGWPLYYKADRHLILLPRAASFKDVADGALVGAINWFEMDLSKAGTAAMLKDKDADPIEYRLAADKKIYRTIRGWNF